MKYNPSIEFLELYAFCLGVFTWIDEIAQEARAGMGKIYLFCDNNPVVGMLNLTTSSCKYCMTLIRKLTLLCITFNIRILGKYISTEDNFLSDNLSRGKIDKFKDLARRYHQQIDQEPSDVMSASIRLAELY